MCQHFSHLLDTNFFIVICLQLINFKAAISNHHSLSNKCKANPDIHWTVITTKKLNNCLSIMVYCDIEG